MSTLGLPALTSQSSGLHLLFCKSQGNDCRCSCRALVSSDPSIVNSPKGLWTPGKGVKGLALLPPPLGSPDTGNLPY